MGIHDYWDDGQAPDWGDGSDWADWADEQQEVELVFDLLAHTTEKAFLLQFGEENVWLPKSRSTINMSMHRNTIMIPKWLMVEKGLEEYCTNKPKEVTETKGLFDKFKQKNVKKLEEDDMDVPF